MGQEFSSTDTIQSSGNDFSLPTWYNPDFNLNHSAVVICRSSINSVLSNDLAVFKRMQQFGYTSSSIDFLYNQFFCRLAVLSPMFIRKLLNIDSHYNGTLRTNDILQSDLARSFFNDVIINPINTLFPLTTIDSIESQLSTIVSEQNMKYGLDASLLTNIAFITTSVFSDCLGKEFDHQNTYWNGFFSKEIKLLTDMKAVSNSYYTSFSLKETMLKLNQPFIEWSDGLLGTQYSPVDRQHKWLLTIINVLIHICSNNTLQINLIDVLEALYDYTCIHFVEEEMIFMDVIVNAYSEKDYHKHQHIEFLGKLSTIKNELNVSTETQLSQQVLDYMISWLTNHIRVVDKHMIDVCLSQKNGSFIQ